MLYKIVTLYRTEEDPETFIEFYRENIVPRLLNFDGVVKSSITRLLDPDIGQSSDPSFMPYSVMGELYLVDVKSFMHFFQNTEEGQEIAGFLESKSKDSATVYLGIEESFYK